MPYNFLTLILPLKGSEIAGGLGITLVISLLFVVYFLPTLIALLRKKSNTLAIAALNLLLGWSVIGWVVSLVWSLSSDPVPQKLIVQQPVQHTQSDGIDRLSKLKKLLDDNVISQEEFEREKAKILNC